VAGGLLAPSQDWEARTVPPGRGRRPGPWLLGLLAVLYAALAVLPAAPGSVLVPATVGGSPGWLLGPLAGVGAAGAGGPAAGPLFLAGLAAAFVLQLGVLRTVGQIPLRAVVAAVVLAHALFLLAPPLLSQDVFSYLAYARLDAIQGLDPYAATPLDAPGDPVLPFAGSRNAPSVYGPLFTLLTLPLADLPVPVAFWVLKVVAAAASLGVVALVARLAARLGRDPCAAVVLVGLHPLVLVHVVAAAHNEALVMLVTLAGVSVWVGRRQAAGVVVAAGAVGLKASAALVLPFLALSTRGGRGTAKAVAGAIAVLAGVLLVGLLAFGPDAGGIARLLGNQAHTSSFSLPRRLAEALEGLGLAGPHGARLAARVLAGALLAGVLLVLLRRTRHGADPLTMAGWATLATLLASAWLVPWYAMWLLPLAAVAGSRRLTLASLALTAWMLPIAVPL